MTNKWKSLQIYIVECNAMFIFTIKPRNRVFELGTAHNFTLKL
jgi:hypothetical protein